jgi:exodeoxyribonuclease VII large subunit
LTLAQQARLAAVQRRLESGKIDLRTSQRRWLGPKRRRFEAARGKLAGLDPLSVLDRGYSLVTDEAGHPLRDARQVERGDHVSVRMSHGALGCRVEEVAVDESLPEKPADSPRNQRKT